MVKGSLTPSEHVRKGVANPKVMYLPLENKILFNDCKISFAGKEHGHIVPKEEQSTKMASRKHKQEEINLYLKNNQKESFHKTKETMIQPG